MLKHNGRSNVLGFFRRLLPKDDRKSEKKRLLKQLDEVDMCVVDVETLRCAICFNIFQGTPQFLPCGHSFCFCCIEEVANAELINEIREHQRNTFQCPICRKKATMGKVVPNFTLKSILDSINELSKQEEESRKAFDNTLDASNEQLRAQCLEFERTADQLRRQIHDMRQKEYYNYVAISFFVIIYIILSTVFGN